MFFVVFIDKSDRFADLPYSAGTKMASVGERAVSARSKYDFNKNNG
jgi:hypothetical protein